PADLPTSQVRVTPPTAPANAASWTHELVPAAGSAVITTVTAKPAPAAAPNKYGSARGLRKTPWKAAPDTARAAPTSAPSTTRGTRSCHRIAASRSVRGDVP